MKRSLSLVCMLASTLGVSALAQASAPSQTAAESPSAPAAPLSAAPAGPTKIAVIQFEAVVGQTNEGQRAFAELNTKYQPKQQQTESNRMSYRPYQEIIRRKSRRVYVGRVPVGDGAPITVQTMTNTITGDARATIEQIRRIEEAGCDIVRVSCPDEEATAAMKAITEVLRQNGLRPLVLQSHARACLDARRDADEWNARSTRSRRRLLPDGSSSRRRSSASASRRVALSGWGMVSRDELRALGPVRATGGLP